MKRFAIIPTNGRDCLSECLDAIYPQVDAVILIANGGNDGGVINIRPQDGFDIIDVSEHPRIQGQNISAWWNLGLDHLESEMNTCCPEESWRVAILNDDTIVSSNWFEAVEARMRETDASAACAGSSTHLLVQPGPVPLHTRMTGFAFMLRGEEGIRANEDLHWYFTDDYIDWESRKRGGMAMTDQASVQHLYPNGQVTPEIQTRIAHDAQNFKDLYGIMPW